MPLTPADLTQIRALIASELAANRIKISALPDSGVVERDAVAPIVQSGATVKMSLGRLLALGVSVVPTGQDLRNMDLTTVVNEALFYTENVLAGDGVPGVWVYDADSVATDNTGTVIAPDSGVGRFLRQFVGDIYYEWFGTQLGDNVAFGPDNDVAVAAAHAVAKPLGATLVLPVGTLLVSTHFIHNFDDPPSVLDDYNGMTVIGRGRSSIVKQQNAGGTSADVFNINGIKNLNLLNFTITSEISTGASGTNGVSIINGAENIFCRDLFADRMPYMLSGVDFDGGSAYTIQHSVNSLNDRNIQFINCSAEGNPATQCGAYGFNFQWSGAGQISNPPQGVFVLGGTIRAHYRGIYCALTVAATPEAEIPGMQVSIEEVQCVDVQQWLTAYGMTGLSLQNNQFTSSYTGNPGFNAATPLKFALIALSNFNSTIAGNVGYIAESDWFALVGAGASGQANTPTDRLNFSHNHFYGDTDAVYGLMSSTTIAYGGTTNSNFIGNTFQGQSGADYHPLFSTDGASNTIIDSDGSYFPSVVQSTFNAADEQIEGWTQGGTPFDTLTVNANDHDITSLIAGGANQFAGWQIDLVPGRVYELTASVGAGQLVAFTNASLGTDQNGSLAGIVTTSVRTMIFKAAANDNFLVLKSQGAQNYGAVTISLKEAPINCQAGLWVENNARIGMPTYASNIDAINGGQEDGCLFSDGSGFVHVVQPL